VGLFQVTNPYQCMSDKTSRTAGKLVISYLSQIHVLIAPNQTEIE